MSAYSRELWKSIMERTAKNLEANNMKCYIVDSKDDVVPLIKEIMNDGDTVACGGSMTLAECGVHDLLKSGAYNYLDRDGKSGDELQAVFRCAFSADSYLSSANAITENGELYNVDGNSNRVAAICFGPKSVIIVAGRNKIVRSLDDAIIRVKRIAAPMNTARLGCETYCNSKGECMSLASGGNCMTDGCKSTSRICCSYVVTAQQRIKDRIKVILVNEELGF